MSLLTIILLLVVFLLYVQNVVNNRNIDNFHNDGLQIEAYRNSKLRELLEEEFQRSLVVNARRKKEALQQLHTAEKTKDARKIQDAHSKIKLYDVWLGEIIQLKYHLDSVAPDEWAKDISVYDLDNTKNSLKDVFIKALLTAQDKAFT